MTEKVIALLNDGRSRELTALSQYMAQHYELANEGMVKVASKLKAIAIEEMKHAELLAERILFLNGEPTYKPDATVKKGEEIAALLQTDIDLEAGAIKTYNDAAVICAAERDQISKQLFESLLADEEEHLDYFQKTLQHIEKLGAAYLATLME
ncbi:MAG: bacterioferritin [Dehalococcoidia bacterium]|nr:bacterioferritin [Dehalococcoidia bacterium]